MLFSTLNHGPKMTKLFTLSILQTMILSYALAQYQSSCSSSYGENVACISIRQCPQILNLLQMHPLTPEVIRLLQKLQCGFENNNPLVCCSDSNTSIRGDGNNFTPFQNSASQNSYENTDNANPQYDFSNNPLLPTDCGKDLSQRIVGGEFTELDEFPWMALLEYSKPNGKSTACGGVLISRRYVLTAAHCVKGKDLPSTWRLQSVRLGEYDTDTNPDCIQDSESSKICADDPVTYGVEEQIAHENYRPLSRDQKYDIALLRLSRDVTFTNYIKAICLPPTAFLRQKLFAAGWGKTENGTSSNIKLKVSLPLVDKKQCQSTYEKAGLSLGYGQICAGGEKDKDSCRGDSGGPLMTVEKNRDGTGRWIAVGVVSFGPSPCGKVGWPGIYTRVIDFVPWILSKLKPCSNIEIPYISGLISRKIQKGTLNTSCGVDMISIFFLLVLDILFGISAQDRCNISQNKVGVCISILNCQPLINILKQRPLSEESLKYLNSLQCGFQGTNPKVCCEQNSETSTITNSNLNPVVTRVSPPDVTNHPNLQLVNEDLCGPVTQQKIYGGNKTGIFDYPWMALLSYDIENQRREFRCGGSLINRRYVLTAAHCVMSLPTNIKLIGVRLGEHNLSTERDCDKDANGLELACAPRYQDFGIESTHFHPKYSNFQNDIALLRLNGDADFVQNVRPICLPIGSSNILNQTKVTVTGWGITEKNIPSQSLLQVQLSLVNTEECLEVYKRKVQISYKQICAGGKDKKDSCGGDSGGPLQAPGIYNQNLKYIQYGIVSFGPRICATEKLPGVYTNIVYYMDWILNTIKA
ncbi:PREDICTED: uncharacterized protein LOC108547293 [Eufriesea mexicana]|uniref:uncharacterized protein LOC108547293 n=1 Tax=Eufriesea mexicana TaxID=516756 RepID=UPI00083BDDFE|nr:PREDICTED: uncharacterized protein LOC108547293 [Eufriesea mexicana]